MNNDLIREELEYIRKHLQLDYWQAADVHQKAEEAMDKQESDWTEQVHVCPYCLKTVVWPYQACCGEAGHAVPMKLAQYNYMLDCDKSIEQALAYTGEQE